MIVTSSIKSPPRTVAHRPGSPQTDDLLDDVTLHVMRVHTGEMASEYTFHNDQIQLTGHAGVSMLDDILLVTSIRRQTIYMLQLLHQKLVLVREIGWYNYDDDARFFEQTSTATVPTFVDTHAPMFPVVPITPVQQEPQTTMHSGIKQRFLSCLYRKALLRAVNDPTAMAHFHRTLPHFASLILTRARLLDHSHILIKFTEEELVFGQSSMDAHYIIPSFYAVYNLHTTQVVEVYHNSDEHFQHLVDASMTQLRACATNEDARMDGVYLQSHAGNNIDIKASFMRNWEFYCKMRKFGKAHATKRGLATFPVPPQTCTPSPYVDSALFSYDEKHISPYERLKQYTDMVRIYSRETGRLKFGLTHQDTQHAPLLRKYHLVVSA
jgi:de-etiolated-1